jgi:PAS domain S-box-containing protein
VGGELIVFTVPTLSIGDVAVAVRPVGSAEDIERLARSIRSIRGVDRVIVDRVDRDSVHLVAHTDRPVPLASEIRATLRQRVVSCTVNDGEIAVDLAGAPPRHQARPAQEEPAVRDRGAPAATQTSFDGGPVKSGSLVVLDDVEDLTILTFDTQQRYTACVGGLHRSFGLRFSEMRGRPAREIVSPYLWPQVEGAYAAALRGEERTIDVDVSRHGRIVEAAFRPLRDDHTTVGGMLIMRDVTQQRQAAAQLAEYSAVLQVTFDGSPTPFALLAPDGRYVRVNAAMQDLLGLTEAALVAEHVESRMPADEAAVEGVLRAEMAAGRRPSYVRDVHLQHADGRRLPVTTTVTAIRLGDELRGSVLTAVRRA